MIKSDKRLKTPFCPVWSEDFTELLPILKPTATILLMYYRSLAINSETQIIKISDSDIQSLLGIHRNTTKTARNKLEEHGFIKTHGYNQIYVRCGNRYDGELF